MKRFTDNYNRKANIEIHGEVTEAGNGMTLAPAAGTGLTVIPKITSIGDDAAVSLALGVQTAAGTFQDRLILNANAKTIVDGSATSLFTVACATGTMVGGVFDFLVRLSDGTDFQALAGRASYAAVNKAGVHTGSIVHTAASSAYAESSAVTDLSLAFTIVTGTSLMTIKVQPTGALTETTPYTIMYNVQPIHGAVTIV